MDISEARLARIARTSQISGTTGTNLLRAAHRLGFRAEIKDNAGFGAIERWLRKGVPVIVDWMSVERDGARGHYSVVCGLGEDHIVLQDPAIGRRRKMTRRGFLAVWYDFKYLFPRRSDELILRRMIVVAPPIYFGRRG